MKVEFFWPGIGLKIREFTLEEHGVDFEKLAKEFATTQRGRVVPEDHVLPVVEIPEHVAEGRQSIVLEPAMPSVAPQILPGSPIIPPAA